MKSFEHGVVVVAKGYPPDLGGVQTYSREIASELRRLKFRCVVVTSRPGSRGVVRERGIGVVNVGNGVQLKVGWRMFWILRRLRRSRRLDMAWATTWRVGMVLMLLRWPFGLTVHGREIRDDRGRWLRWPMRFVLNSAQHILAISQYSYSTFVDARYRAKASWAWNGASAWAKLLPGGQRETSDAQADGSCPPIRILFAARMVASKNVCGAVRGFVHFLSCGGRGELWIAGVGCNRAEAEAIAIANECLPHIHFLGYLQGDQLINEYRAADVFLHPHIGIETFCLAVADAMAAGLAVVAGQDGAPKEYLQVDRGVLVDGRNHEQIGMALLRLQNDPEGRNAMGCLAADFAASMFTWRAHTFVMVKSLFDGTMDDDIGLLR